MRAQSASHCAALRLRRRGPGDPRRGGRHHSSRWHDGLLGASPRHVHDAELRGRRAHRRAGRGCRLPVRVPGRGAASRPPGARQPRHEGAVQDRRGRSCRPYSTVAKQFGTQREHSTVTELESGAVFGWDSKGALGTAHHRFTVAASDGWTSMTKSADLTQPSFLAKLTSWKISKSLPEGRARTWRRSRRVSSRGRARASPRTARPGAAARMRANRRPVHPSMLASSPSAARSAPRRTRRSAGS